MTQQSLPNDTEAEARLLSLLLHGNEFIPDAINMLAYTDFYSAKHQAIFQAIVDMEISGKSIDLVTICDHLKKTGKLKQAGGASYVDQVYMTPVAPGADQYSRIIFDKATLRRLCMKANGIVNLCYSDGDTSEIVERAHRAIGSITEGYLKSDIVSDQRINEIAMRLTEWATMAPGEFNLMDVINQFDRETNPMDLTMALEKMVNEEVLERVGSRRGVYRPRKGNIDLIDYKTAKRDALKIWLPFGMQQLVNIMPGNIIMVSGAPNAGKTALMLNIALDNEGDYTVHYFSSEMGASEMNLRLSKYRGRPISAMRFHAYRRDGDFSDAIKPGLGVINIIDFLEMHSDFYSVGQKIKDIHDRLNGAIAFVAMQKNPGKGTALGGYRMMEKARLAISLEKNELEITKAKNYAKPETNPNGMKIRYKIFDGINLSAASGWV